MDIDFTAIAFFAAIVLPIKWIIDARFRHKMIQAGLTGDLQRQWFDTEINQRRQSSLRWGSVLVLVAIGFAIVQIAGWQEMNAAAVAVLVATTGLGHLLYVGVSRRFA
ncbi:hypothetical protein KPL74_15680 [Bacillus sp. NP157]|nr:hypothetical protein KPL74_15680 [Bacillus sp. NP157]